MAFKNPIRALSQLFADIITGATIQTAATGVRWVINSSLVGGLAEIAGYTADSHEAAPAIVAVGVDNTLGHARGYLGIESPDYGTGPAQVVLTSDPTTGLREVDLAGDVVNLLFSQLQLTGLTGVIKGINVGQASVTLTSQASNSVLVNHGLGVTPRAILLTMGSNTVTFLCTYGNANATSFSINAFTKSGATASATLSISWVAIA